MDNPKYLIVMFGINLLAGKCLPQTSPPSHFIQADYNLDVAQHGPKVFINYKT